MRYRLVAATGEGRASRPFESEEEYGPGDHVTVGGEWWRIDEVSDETDDFGKAVRQLICVPSDAPPPTRR